MSSGPRPCGEPVDPCCLAEPAPAGTVWHDRYRHAEYEDFNGFRNCDKMAGSGKGAGKMGRVHQFIWSGRASLYLAVISLLAHLVAYYLLTTSPRFSRGLEFGIDLLLIGMGSIAISIALAFPVLFDPPMFQRSNAILTRVAISTNIGVLIGCVYFVVGISLFPFIKRMD